MNVGDRIRNLREKDGVSREQLAQSLEITYAALSKYETSKRQVDYETLIKIADYFDVTTDYLLGRNEYAHGVSKEEPSIYLQLGIDRDKYESLPAYQQEALNWAVNSDYLQFKNKSDNILDMIERIEIAYEVEKAMQNRKKNNK